MNTFQFKQFSIVQENTAMKVGTDGVLLGAWVNSNGKKILDIGTGTGLIPLMLTQRNDKAKIDAVEINEEAYQEAKMNFQNSNWSDRLAVFNIAIQDYQPNKLYDNIVCNPPFFIDSTKAPATNRTTARHTRDLSFEDLISSVKRLLSPDGVFSAILPIEESKSLIDIATKNELFLSRRCLVKPNFNKNPKRVLLEFSFQKKPIEETELTIETENRHEYTKEYITLTKDFYLKH